MAHRQAALRSAPNRIGRRAQGAGFSVERPADQGIHRLFHLGGQVFHRSGAVIHPLPVRGEDREGLEDVRAGGFRESLHPVAVKIGHAQVGGRVEHFHPAVSEGMHARDDDIGREDAVSASRMDFAIDRGGDHRRILERQLPEFPIPVEDGAAALAPEVEHRKVSPSLGVDVAVHALVLRVAPVGDGPGVEGGQVPLDDLQVVPDLESGLDEPVGQVAVDGIGTHVDGPGEGHRTGRGLVLRRHLHIGSGRQDPGPFLLFPDHIPPPDGHGLPGRRERRHEAGALRIRIVEIQRSDVAGHRNLPVVRENGRRPVGPLSVRAQVRPPPARKEQEEREDDQPGPVTGVHSAQHSRSSTNRFFRIPRSGSCRTLRPACRW